MARRIALCMVALVAVLLAGAVVPLGLVLTAQLRSNFDDDVRASARAIASTAEEQLGDHHAGDDLPRILQLAAARGDCVAVYDRGGATLATTPCQAGVTATDPPVAAALAHRGDQAGDVGGRFTAVELVGDGDHPEGVAALSRSSEPVSDRTRDLWLFLSAIGVGGLLAGLLVALALARWVTRPLTSVGVAARRLGDGELAARAPVGGGPQEVQELARSFNAMAARLEALVHSHRATTADVSHQLRTPLAALRLRLDVLAATADDAVRGELAGAQEEITRLSRLVDGLLAVARAENTVPEPVAVRVGDVIEQRVAAWEPVARERGITLTGEAEPRLYAALGSGHLEQVLDNLVANALDALPEGRRVRVDAAPGDGMVRVRVVDNGPGMDAERRATAFRRFGDRGARGTGLGLAIVHRLVTANGGTVRLDETPGGGLTAVVELRPAAAPGAEGDRPGGRGNGPERRRRS